MPYQAGRMLAVAKRVSELGSSVDFEPGWESRGYASFYPRVHVLHHDAAAKDVIWLIRDGHASLSGPLANWYITRDGTLWCIAAGYAHHAGQGDWFGIAGNQQAWGTEVANDGKGERYTPAQLRTIERLHIALVTVDRIQLGLCCSHAEWAPRRKSDIGDGPGRPWNMEFYRAVIARRIEEGGLSMADIKTITDKLGAIEVQLAAIHQQAVKWDEETKTGIATRIALMTQEILTAVRPGTEFNRGVVTKLGKPISTGAVDEEALAHAIVAGLALEVRKLGEEGIEVDLPRLAEHLAPAVVAELGSRLTD